MTIKLEPSGLEVKTWGDDRVHIGGYDLSMTDFCEAVKYVLINSDLVKEDSRLKLLQFMATLIPKFSYDTGFAWLVVDSQECSDAYEWYASTDGGERWSLLSGVSDRDGAIAKAIDLGYFTEIEPIQWTAMSSGLPGELVEISGPEWGISVLICEATKYGLDDIEIDGNNVLESLYNRHDDWGNPDSSDSPFDCTNEQGANLTIMLTAAYRKWAKIYGTEPESWLFKDVRNEETVFLPHPGSI